MQPFIRCGFIIVGLSKRSNTPVDEIYQLMSSVQHELSGIDTFIREMSDILIFFTVGVGEYRIYKLVKPLVRSDSYPTRIKVCSGVEQVSKQINTSKNDCYLLHCIFVCCTCSCSGCRWWRPGKAMCSCRLSPHQHWCCIQSKHSPAGTLGWRRTVLNRSHI